MMITVEGCLFAIVKETHWASIEIHFGKIESDGWRRICIWSWLVEDERMIMTWQREGGSVSQLKITLHFLTRGSWASLIILLFSREIIICWNQTTSHFDEEDMLMEMEIVGNDPLNLCDDNPVHRRVEMDHRGFVCRTNQTKRKMSPHVAIERQEDQKGWSLVTSSWKSDRAGPFIGWRRGHHVWQFVLISSSLFGSCLPARLFHSLLEIFSPAIVITNLGFPSVPRANSEKGTAETKKNKRKVVYGLEHQQ